MPYPTTESLCRRCNHVVAEQAIRKFIYIYILLLNAKLRIKIFHLRFLQKALLIQISSTTSIRIVTGHWSWRTLCTNALPPHKAVRASLSASASGLQARLTRGRLPGGRREIARTQPWRSCGVVVGAVGKVQRRVRRVPVLDAQADPRELVLRQALRLQVRTRLDPALLVDPLRVRYVVHGAEDGARF